VEAAEADVFLVEIKAAAIDVVCEAAADLGLPVVFADNDVVPVAGQGDLDTALRGLADTALSTSTEAVA
jgi:cyclic 2,3-diphosphoglycerate synthetase